MDGTITRWNKGAEKIYGYTEAEVIGQSISILIPSDDRDEVPRILGRLERGEVIIHTKPCAGEKMGKKSMYP